MPLFRLLLSWLRACGVITAAVALIWPVVQLGFHLRLLNVQTGSMQPTFRRGDALVMRRIGSKELHSGMIVSYRSSRNPNELITHRVIKVTAAAFQTKGDALTNPDPAVRGSLAVGKVVAVVPGLGKLLSWSSTWLGLGVTVYLPTGLLLISELTRLEHHYRNATKYVLYKAQVV